MNNRDQRFQEQRLSEILGANQLDDVGKSQAIIRLGFDPEIADELVERHHLGRRQPEYYESLNFAEMDDLPLPNRHA
ncbi:hypothetical protein IPG36_04575 [bacterium]|nr:MAG: hypothetical protein IPG36_04575 [bacterium]